MVKRTLMSRENRGAVRLSEGGSGEVEETTHTLLTLMW